jgi:hypothetical protein
MAIPFSEEDFDTPMNGPPGQPPADIIDQMAQVREEQAKSLQEHMQYRAGLEQKQQEVELRSGDLDVSERLMKVFDTTLPKPFREFELRGLSRHLGIDPKGENFKEISKVVMGLDPDSSGAVREAFTARIADATPGQISEFTKGILQGKVPISSLAGMVREHQMAQAQIGGGLSDAGPSAIPSNASATPAPGDAGAKGGMAAGNTPRSSIKDAFAGGRESGNATVQQTPPDIGPSPTTTDPNTIIAEGPAPTDNRVVDPSVASALGYDANKVPSAEILARHPGIGGMDGKEQKEAAKKLAEYRQYTQETVKLADKLDAVVTSDPNTVPYTLPIIGRWAGQNINAAKEITSANDAIKQLSEAIFPEGVNAWVRKNVPNMDSDEKVRETGKKAQEVMNTLFALAYMSAKAKDPSGRLSDQDLQLELKGLGADSGSADLLKSALRAHVGSTVDRYNTRIQTETGGPGVDIKATGATIQRQGAAPTDPAAAGATQQAQATNVPGTVVTTPGQTPSQTPTQTPAQQTPADQSRTARSREEAKNADETVQQQTRKFNLEQAPVEARLRLEAAQRDEVRLQLAMDAAKEAKEWKEYQKLKDQKAEARREREKIQSAFAAFARALGNSRGGGGIGGTPSMGADQDAGAFKIAPGAGTRRAPPQPGEAKSGYTYTRKRREMTGGG